MKVAIVYASTTGNTQALANAICEQSKAAGHEVIFAGADEADCAKVSASDYILLGSPAMGCEQLEDTMESFFSNIEGSLTGKKVALFGSYDWGDGQWLSDWADRVKASGATVTGCVKAHLAPEDSDIESAKALLSL